MANKIESTEITQPKKVYVKSEEALDEMEANGQLEPFTDYFTPEDEESDEIEKQFDLLWQNSNPSASQGGIDVSIPNLSQYNVFVLKVNRAKDYAMPYSYTNYSTSNDEDFVFNTIGVFGYSVYCRNVFINKSSNQLQINTAYIQSGIGSGSANTDKLIVTHLYGLKTRLYTKLGTLPNETLLYNFSSNDPDINLGLTAGIYTNTPVTIPNLRDYNRIRIYTNHASAGLDFVFECLVNPNYEKLTGYTTVTASGSYMRMFSVTTNGSNNTLTLTRMGSYTFPQFVYTNELGNSGNRIAKIVGIKEDL